MQSNELIKRAYEFLKSNNLDGIYKLSDIGNSIVAFGGNPNSKIYGCRSVEVNKDTGETKLFAAWFPSNMKLLDNALDIEIPENYLYKEGE